MIELPDLSSGDEKNASTRCRYRCILMSFVTSFCRLQVFYHSLMLPRHFCFAEFGQAMLLIEAYVVTGGAAFLQAHGVLVAKCFARVVCEVSALSFLVCHPYFGVYRHPAVME